MRSHPPTLAAEPTPSGAEATAQRLETGAVVAERYRVVSFLGEGGMGAVYRVEHQHIRKAYALKVLHRNLMAMPEAVARFEREAVAAGSIDHPNVAAATDFGRLPDGSFFLILEFVPGRSLRDELEAGPLEAVRASKIMRGIVAGVGAAHAKGIVHRDLKPENVMLVAHDGDPDFAKVLDFGIAKVQEAPTDASGGAVAPLTRAGSILGTFEYMSPEQAVGNPVDARSDLYSLGVIFYELLAGRCPFQGDAVALLRQHLLDDAPPLPDPVVAGLDPRTVGIVRRLLAKQPEDRFASAWELGLALSEMAAPVRVQPPPAGASASLAPAGRSSPRLGVMGAAGAAVLLVVALSLFFLFGNGDRAGLVSPPAPGEPGSPPASASAAAVPARAPDPETASVALPPPPDPAASSSTSPQRHGASAPGHPPADPGAPAHRRTGPGGIYIPPPSDWFK